MFGLRHRFPFALGRSDVNLRGASRYDLVLAVIPAVFLGAAVLQELTVLTPTMTALMAGGLSGLAVIDALFLNPPGEPSTNDSTA